ALKPDENILIIDGTIGQQAGAHAAAFHKAAPVGSIIVTKLDTSAKGGGALTAVAETGALVKFVGVGERI
ncbi:MAG: signal recognition particle protein Srp19, partial [Candidatus Caldarchaeum sp.]